MTKKHKAPIVPLLIAVIASLAIGGIYYYTQVQNADQIDAAVAAQAPARPVASAQPGMDNDTPAEQASERINFAQTYENTAFGFQVQYPSDWHIGAESQQFDEVGYDFDLTFCPASLYENGNCKFTKTAHQGAKLFAPISLNIYENGMTAPSPSANTKIFQGPKYTYRLVLRDEMYKVIFDAMATSFVVSSTTAAH